MHVVQHTLSAGFTIHHCSSCNARVLKLRGLVKKIEEFVTEKMLILVQHAEILNLCNVLSIINMVLLSLWV